MEINWTPTASKKPHTEVSGVSAVNNQGNIEWYRLWARHAERDSLNRTITSTYLTQASASGNYVTKFEFQQAINQINNTISNVSSTLSSEIDDINIQINQFNEDLNYISGTFDVFSGVTTEDIAKLNEMITGYNGLSANLSSLSSHIYDELSYDEILDPYQGFSSYNSSAGKITFNQCENTASNDTISSMFDNWYE